MEDRNNKLKNEHKLSKKERAKAQSKTAKKPKSLSKIKTVILNKNVPILNKIIAIFLIAFSIFTLSLVFSFLYRSYKEAKDPAKILSQESTVMLAEFNLNKGNLEEINEISQNTIFDPKKIIDQEAELWGINFDQEIKPWAGEKVSLALIKKTQSDKNPNLVYFIETKDRSASKQFFSGNKLTNKEKIIEEKYKSYTVYEYQLSQKIVYTFIQRYLVFSNSKDALKKVISDYVDNDETLKKSENYIQVVNNLPVHHMGFLYLNINEASPLLPELPIIAKKYPQVKYALPFLDVFPVIGAVIVPKTDGLAVSTYTVISKNNLKNRASFAKDQKYSANLLNFINADSEYLVGGMDLEKEFKRFLEILKDKNLYVGDIAEGYIRHLKTKYFGEEINLEKEIYPLFKKEYLFSMSGDKEKGIDYLFLQKVEEQEEAIKIIAKLKNKFVSKNAFFDPYVEETKNEKGETIKEIKNPPGLINEVKSSYKNIPLVSLIIPGLEKQVSYAFKDDLLIISSNEKKIKDIIDKEGNMNNFKKIIPSSNYNFVRKIINYSDETIYIDLKNIFEKTFLPISMTFSGSQIFDDGISTISYLKFAEKPKK